MDAQMRLRLTRDAALGLIVSMALWAEAVDAQQVARVQFASGEVSATGTDGRARVLARGSELAVGETVSTEQGRAQLQFTDGAVVSLQPRTAFRIDDFRFDGKADGNEKGFFSLLRGGLRTVTGLIGRSNRDAYRVTTSTATIGIRGTEYLAEVGNSLRVAVGGGRISITNDAGVFVIEQGQSAFVADAKSLPVITFDKPVLPPAGAGRGGPAGTGKGTVGEAPPEPSRTVIVGERVDTPAVATPGSVGTTIAGLGVFTVPANEPYLYLAAGETGLNSANQAVRFTEPLGVQFAAGTASASESSFDGTVGLGRWTNGTVQMVYTHDETPPVTFTLGANQGVHHVFGVPTLTDQRPNSVIAQYGLLASTKATSVDGFLGLGTLSPGAGAGQPMMAIDFQAGRVGVDLGVTFPSRAYRALTVGGIATPAASQIALNGSVMFNLAPIDAVRTLGGSCDESCSADLVGFLAGDGASRAGFAYGIRDGLSTIQGTATVTRTGTSPLTTVSELVGISPVAANTDDWALRPGTVTFAGADSSTPVLKLSPTGGPQFIRGSAGVTDTFRAFTSDGQLGIGRWTSGTYFGRLDDGRLVTGFADDVLGVHYLHGTPASVRPVSGGATFSLLAATRATAATPSVTGLGTVVGFGGDAAPILAVDFASGRVGMDFGVDFSGGRSYRVTTTGGLSSLTASEVSLGAGGREMAFGSTLPIPTTGSGGACDVGCSTAVRGFLAGSGSLQSGGFLYGISDNVDFGIGVVEGAVAAQFAGEYSPTSQQMDASFSFSASGGSYLVPLSQGLGSVQPVGRLVTFVGTPLFGEGSVALLPGTATHAESGFDGTVGYGRLANGVVTMVHPEGEGSLLSLSAAQGLHYAYRRNDSNVLPSFGVVTYGLAGATKPTVDDGSLPPGIFTGAMAVDLASRQVGLDFNVTFPGLVYGVKTQGGIINPRQSQVTMGGFAQFSAGLLATRNGSNCGHHAGCYGFVEGFLASATDTTQRAGLTYQIADIGQTRDVHGAATFTQSTLVLPPGGITTNVGYEIPMNHALANGPADDLVRVGAFLHQGTTGTVETAGALVGVVVDGSDLLTIGGASPAQTGNDGLIGWTRWVSGTLGGNSSGRSQGTLVGDQSMHHIYGMPTPLATLAAHQSVGLTATYALIGHTMPTSDGPFTTGTLNGASLAVRFGPGQVDFTGSITNGSTSFLVAANNLPIAGSGGIGNPITGSTFGGFGAYTSGPTCSTGCDTTVKGFFAGPQAERAGVAYSILDVSGRRLSGVAAFGR